MFDYVDVDVNFFVKVEVVYFVAPVFGVIEIVAKIVRWPEDSILESVLRLMLMFLLFLFFPRGH